MPPNSSPRPKSVALMFLLGAFLAGGAVAYAAVRTLSASSTVVQFTPAQMRSEIKQKLSLSPEQVAKFEAAYDDRRSTLDSIRATYQPVIDSIRAAHQPAVDSVRVANHARVMLFLDSTQQATYRQMIENDKKRADSLRKAGAAK